MIDLRSDTVTLPSPAMREAMATAEVGDDVYGEDPTINKLEALAAERLGKEAAVFVTSGTQGNLAGVLSHCQRGEEYIVGDQAHIYRYEAGGAAVLGSAMPCVLPMAPGGTLDLAEVEGAIKPEDSHFPRTRLLCLEDTHNGRVVPLDYLAEATDLARRRGLGTHLDGARVFNAAVKLGVDVRQITRYFDTVSFCLSKGLAAPVGSLLCGPADKIAAARRLRKILGGGMRQAGILAAAGLVALEEMIERLADDHANARRLAEGLAELPGFGIDLDSVETNMVFVRLDPAFQGKLGPFLKERGIIVNDRRSPMRLVTHYGIDGADIERVVAAAREFVEGRDR